ncbi:MAG: SpoIIE family protein phosphatase [Planctomycetota bacterium]|jgi:sigma-B regulation protein RsbU (phosphoserine phosphatase)
MKIREKRMVLLIVIALVPAVLVLFFSRRSMLRTGDYLGDQMREILIEDAELYLQTLVDDFSQLTQRDKIAIELALARQAQEVERRLAAAPPEEPELFFSHEYDNETRLPRDMQLTDKYRKIVDGKEVRIPLSFDQQVFFVVEGAEGEAVSQDMARLSTMPKVYRELLDTNPKLMTWLYTSLDVGFHSCYPGHGGYPRKYDPRVRQWYTDARDSDALTWTLLPDVSTRTVSVTASVPVKYPDGSFAGVTAIDVRLAGVLEITSLPDSWKDTAAVLHVIPHAPDGKPGEKLFILVQESYIRKGEQWEREIEQELLDSPDTDQMNAMRADIAAGKSNVRRMTYKSTDSLWAYSAWEEGHALTVVIVPYEQVIAAAAETQRFILVETVDALKTTGLILACVLVVAVIIAIASARSVTRPVQRLADAAKRLSGGDFGSRVDIRTRDEMQELGEIFNDMGPQLEERQKMKHALELARDIQEDLLPPGPPQLEGFDIAGKSVPCDETGGDYYDFIDLVDLAPGKLGIALGDVTGHGIPAALLMASARSALRNQVPYHGEALDALFDKLNIHLVRDTGAARFITLFYGLLDAKARTLRWASGGHDPALWLQRASGKITELSEPRGVPLGVIEETSYEHSSPVQLEAGDLIMVGTDGIWEAMNSAGEQFGKERLRGILCERSASSAQEICSAIVAAVTNFRGQRPQDDDITLVVIKVAETS